MVQLGFLISNLPNITVFLDSLFEKQVFFHLNKRIISRDDPLMVFIYKNFGKIL